ncbi:hypothetical protein HPG69_013989 [Diceros bicornis minor]|uniref:Uncharacterized protein n=1 Tax=Diceros bicornis minor TaxID=77932 RepID=A0A7J7EN81_DICBM|nr:hypothetical protein HPG69_013989 [Diceros bicornis minor]
MAALVQSPRWAWPRDVIEPAGGRNSNTGEASEVQARPEASLVTAREGASAPEHPNRNRLLYSSLGYFLSRSFSTSENISITLSSDQGKPLCIFLMAAIVSHQMNELVARCSCGVHLGGVEATGPCSEGCDIAGWYQSTQPIEIFKLEQGDKPWIQKEKMHGQSFPEVGEIDDNMQWSLEIQNKFNNMERGHEHSSSGNIFYLCRKLVTLRQSHDTFYILNSNLDLVNQHKSCAVKNPDNFNRYEKSFLYTKHEKCYTGIKKPGYSGVTAHKQKGADSWKTCRNYGSGVHQPPTGIIKKSNTNVEDRRDRIKRYKGAHQDKDALGGSGLMGGSGENISAVNVLDTLLVPDEAYEATGPVHKPKHETPEKNNNAAYDESK